MPRFLHTTTSATLVGLAKSEFNVCSPSQLIRQYGFAPMAGEISCGGSVGATVDSAGIAFAEDNENPSNQWGLDSLLRSYGKHGYRKKYVSEDDLQSAVGSALDNNFSTIKEVIIQLMREKQMGEGLVLSPESIHKLLQAIDDKLLKVNRYYYRNYIIPFYFNTSNINKRDYEIRENQAYFMNYLVDRIPLDFFELSEEKKEAFLAKFDGFFKESMKFKGKDENLKFSDHFKRTVCISSDDQNEVLCEFDLMTSFIFPDRRDFIESFLYHNERLFLEGAEQLKSEIEKACCALSEQVERLKETLNDKNIQILTPEEKDFCENTFPLIFILEDAEKLKRISPTEGTEYRAHSKLKLGVDIKTIATEQKNIEKLTEFLAHHNLSSTIRIVSIESLRPNKNANLTATSSKSNSLAPLMTLGLSNNKEGSPSLANDTHYFLG